MTNSHARRRDAPQALESAMRALSFVFGGVAAGGLTGCGEPSAVPAYVPPVVASQTDVSQAEAPQPKATSAAAPRAIDAARQTPRARGVVLFVVDTLRADRLSTSGYSRATSPNLTRFAQRGVRWTNNYAQGSWTVPSMMSMMTGLYLAQESESLPQRQPTLAELLSEGGVETAAFVGNRVIGSSRGFDRGFDHMDVPTVDASMRTVRNITASEWVAKFVAWHAARRNPERPWFAWVHVLDPHLPYEPLKQSDLFATSVRTTDETELLIPRWRAARERVDASPVKLPTAPTHGEAAVAMLRARASYDGEVLQADTGFGELLAYLEKNGGLDDVLVVFAADHGEMLYEFDAYPQKIATLEARGAPNGLADYFTLEHTGYLYEEVWRTPLVMVGPGLRRGQVESGLSENLDITPTVLAALGVDYDGPLNGHSKLGPAVERQAVFGHGVATTAVRTSDGRILVEHPSKRFGLAADGPPAIQLLESGPSGRAVDHATERPTDVAELQALIAAWRLGVVFETNSDIDRAKADEALRALGYLGDAK